MSVNINLRGILESNKLTGPNFPDWLRNIKIVLRSEKILYVLDEAAPEVPPADASTEVLLAYNRHRDAEEMATCLMLASMSPDLQKQHEHLNAHEILMHLQELFGAQSRYERFQTSKELFQCKMTEGSSVGEHVLKMINLIEKLARLGFVMDHELSIDLVLQSLPPSYSHFVLNFNMNRLEATLPELANMLTNAEPSIKKDKGQLMVVESSGTQKKRLKKNKAQKAKTTKRTKGIKKNIAKKDAAKGKCHFCGKDGHWKRNCRAYLASLKEKKHTDASTSGLRCFLLLLFILLGYWIPIVGLIFVLICR